MSIFDERLRRLKHAGQMAVTQQDRVFTPGTFPSSPAATALPDRGPFLLTVPSAAPPVRSGGPRRVPARLVALPAAPQPTSGQPTSRQPALTLPPAAATPVAGPALQPEFVAPRDLPGQQPGQRPPGTPAAGEVPARDQPQEVGASGEPDLHGDHEAYSDSDPYGDYAEALAAGLSSTPPLGLLPPAPGPTIPTPTVPEPGSPAVPADASRSGPLRPASFLETLALNTRPDDRDAAQPPAAAAFQSAVPFQRADPLPATTATPDPAASTDVPSSTFQAAPTPERPAAAAPAQVTQAPGAQPHPEPAGAEARRAAPTGDRGGVPVSPPPTPADAARPQAAPTATARPDSGAAAADPASELPPPTPESTLPVKTPPVTTWPEAQPTAPATGEPAPAEPTRAEPTSAEPTGVDPAAPQAGDPAVDTGPPLVFPEVPTPQERERREQERRELEALLRAGNNDIPVRLPRKPRPPGAAPRAREPEPEEVRPAPPIPADVSQNILARLNRFAELEAEGEVEASPLGFGELLNWRDHHPERNVSPDTGLAAGPDAAPPPAGVQAGVPAPPAPDLPAAPRLRARASRSGRTGRDRAAEPADADEEPDRERPAPTVPPAGSPDLRHAVPADPAPNPAPTGEADDLTTGPGPERITDLPDTPEPSARPESADGRVPVTRARESVERSAGPRLPGQSADRPPQPAPAARVIQTPVESSATPFKPISAGSSEADFGRDVGNPGPFRPVDEAVEIRTGPLRLPDPALRPQADHRSEDRLRPGAQARPSTPDEEISPAGRHRGTAEDSGPEAGPAAPLRAVDRAGDTRPVPPTARQAAGVPASHPPDVTLPLAPERSPQHATAPRPPHARPDQPSREPDGPLVASDPSDLVTPAPPSGTAAPVPFPVLSALEGRQGPFPPPPLHPYPATPVATASDRNGVHHPGLLTTASGQIPVEFRTGGAPSLPEGSPAWADRPVDLTAAPQHSGRASGRPSLLNDFQPEPVPPAAGMAPGPAGTAPSAPTFPRIPSAHPQPTVAGPVPAAVAGRPGAVQRVTAPDAPPAAGPPSLPGRPGLREPELPVSVPGLPVPPTGRPVHPVEPLAADGWPAREPEPGAPDPASSATRPSVSPPPVPALPAPALPAAAFPVPVAPVSALPVPVSPGPVAPTSMPVAPTAWGAWPPLPSLAPPSLALPSDEPRRTPASAAAVPVIPESLPAAQSPAVMGAPRGSVSPPEPLRTGPYTMTGQPPSGSPADPAGRVGARLRPAAGPTEAGQQPGSPVAHMARWEPARPSPAEFPAPVPAVPVERAALTPSPLAAPLPRPEPLSRPAPQDRPETDALPVAILPAGVLAATGFLSPDPAPRPMKSLGSPPPDAPAELQAPLARPAPASGRVATTRPVALPRAEADPRPGIPRPVPPTDEAGRSRPYPDSGRRPADPASRSAAWPHDLPERPTGRDGAPPVPIPPPIGSPVTSPTLTTRPGPTPLIPPPPVPVPPSPVPALSRSQETPEGRTGLTQSPPAWAAALPDLLAPAYREPVGAVGPASRPSGSPALRDLAAALPVAGPVAVAVAPPSGADRPSLPPAREDRPFPSPAAAAVSPVQRLSQALQAAVRQDGHGQPLAPGAQATLARLMGTSVADVRVIRNVNVLPALQAARAEALTVGRTVFLSPDTRLDTPAGAALAAHELTHALRRDQASFVPEVLRRAAGPARPDAHDEEGVALATEHAARPADAAARRAGSPAPWEPPSREADPPAPEPRPAARSVTPSPIRTAPAPPPALPSMPPPPAGGAWMHAAAVDRPAAPAPAAAERQGDGAAVGRRAPVAAAVDLDQVAREVYARLRERLSTELRRV